MDMVTGAREAFAGIPTDKAPQQTEPIAILEEIGQRIRRANIAASVVCGHIEALGNRAFGPFGPCVTGEGDGSVHDEPFAVAQAFASLDQLDQTLAALKAAAERVQHLA